MSTSDVDKLQEIRKTLVSIKDDVTDISPKRLLPKILPIEVPKLYQQLGQIIDGVFQLESDVCSFLNLLGIDILPLKDESE